MLATSGWDVVNTDTPCRSQLQSILNAVQGTRTEHRFPALRSSVNLAKSYLGTDKNSLSEVKKRNIARDASFHEANDLKSFLTFSANLQ